MVFLARKPDQEISRNGEMAQHPYEFACRFAFPAILINPRAGGVTHGVVVGDSMNKGSSSLEYHPREHARIARFNGKLRRDCDLSLWPGKALYRQLQ